MLPLSIIQNVGVWAMLCLGFLLAGDAAQTVPRTDPSGARELFQMLNQERARAGLNALAWDDRLAAAAQQHAESMAEHQLLAHSVGDEPPLSQRLATVPVTYSGENLATSPTLPEAHQGLMQSPMHRANILSPSYDAAGVGVIQREGRYWIVQDFAQRVPEMPDAQAEMRASEAALQVRPEMREVKDNRVHQLACRMARADRLEQEPALRLPYARYVVAYTSISPGELPNTARTALTSPEAGRLAVGACFARTPHYPSGVYWMLMVLYENGKQVAGGRQ